MTGLVSATSATRPAARVCILDITAPRDLWLNGLLRHSVLHTVHNIGIWQQRGPDLEIGRPVSHPESETPY